MKNRIVLTCALFLTPMTAFATVTGTATSASFVCSNSTGPFPFTFPIDTAAAMTVTQNGAVLLSSAYTIAPVNNSYDNGGSVTLNTACPSGQTLVLERVTPVTQLTQFTPYMPALYANIENGLDKLTEIEQEQYGLLAPLESPSLGYLYWNGTAWVSQIPSGTLPAGCAFATSLSIPCGGTGATTAAGANLSITGVTQTGTLGTSSQVSTFPGTLAAGAAIAGSENGVYKVETFTGSTADVKLSACLAAIPYGGTCDARGFGATTQTIAANVSWGTTHEQTILFDPGTAFQPGGPSVTMFSLGKYAHSEGLAIDTTNQSTYSVPAIAIIGEATGAATATTHASLHNTHVTISNTYAGSMCLQYQGSGSGANEISFTNVGNFWCYQGATGIQLLTGGTNGYVNGNTLSNIHIVGSTVGIDINGGTGTYYAQGNTFSNVIIEAGASYPVWLHGNALQNSIKGLIVFDAVTPVLVSDAALANYIEGFFNYTDTATEAGGVRNGFLTYYSSPSLLNFNTVDAAIVKAGGISVTPGDYANISLTNEFSTTQTFDSFSVWKDTSNGKSFACRIANLYSTDDWQCQMNGVTAFRVDTAGNLWWGIGAGVEIIPSTALGYQGPAAGYVLTGITGSATLVSGTVTVSNAAACAIGTSCSYHLTNCGPNASVGIGVLSVGAIAAGTSFVINSLSPTNTVLTTDASTVCWQIN